MDDVDLTTQRQEMELERQIGLAINKADAIDLNGPGVCLACEEEISFSALADVTPRWCDADCRDAWERMRQAMRRNYGLA